MENNCEGCQHKKHNKDPNLHCRVFSQEPMYVCTQHTEIGEIKANLFRRRSEEMGEIILMDGAEEIVIIED